MIHDFIVLKRSARRREEVSDDAVHETEDVGKDARKDVGFIVR